MRHTRVILLALAAFSLSACATIRVFSEDERAPALVDAAGAHLGVKAIMVDRPGRGVTVLRIEKTRWDPERGKQLCGVAEEKVIDAQSVLDALENGVFDCQPEAWSCADEEAVAHELGHVYGLAHTKGGLMNPKLNDDMTVTNSQTAIVNGLALALERACWEK